MLPSRRNVAVKRSEVRILKVLAAAESSITASVSCSQTIRGQDTESLTLGGHAKNRIRVAVKRSEVRILKAFGSDTRTERGPMVAVKRSEVRILKVFIGYAQRRIEPSCSQTIRGQDTERLAVAGFTHWMTELQSNDPRSGY